MTAPAAPTLAESIARLDEAIRTREPLAIGHQWTSIHGGVRLTISTLDNIPGTRRIELVGPGKQYRQRWESSQLGGYAFASAELLLAALRFAERHPGRVPPGVLTPRELEGADPRQQRAML